jgi:hypothetical protein
MWQQKWGRDIEMLAFGPFSAELGKVNFVSIIVSILEAHILRLEGDCNFKFWFWQFLVDLNKCAKFHLMVPSGCRSGLCGLTLQLTPMVTTSKGLFEECLVALTK